MPRKRKPRPKPVVLEAKKLIDIVADEPKGSYRNAFRRKERYAMIIIKSKEHEGKRKPENTGKTIIRKYYLDAKVTKLLQDNGFHELYVTE